jgi:hypothetical protein
MTVLVLILAVVANGGPSPALADEEPAGLESATPEPSPTPTEEQVLDTVVATEESGETDPPLPTPTEVVIEATEESGTSVSDDEPDVEPTSSRESDEPSPTSTSTPAELPTAAIGEPATAEPHETPDESDESTSASNDEIEPTATVTPEPTPHLTISPAPHPDCKIADDQPESITSGAFLDYRCTYEVELTGDYLSSAAVQLDWTVLASIAEGWSVQFLPPVIDPAEPPDWTNESHHLGGFQHTSRLANSTADDTAPFATTEEIIFGLRLHRAACAMSLPSLDLDVSVWASLPEIDNAAIEDNRRESEPFRLTPELASISEPSLAFAGSLDFGDVPVDANGIRNAPAPQTITLTVSGLDQACGTWALGLKAKKLGGEDGSVISAASLNLVSVNDDTRPHGGCPLNKGCDVAVVKAGPGAAPTLTFTLGVYLALPDQPTATTFNSTLTASLAEVET